jgi:hypothetical protein
MNKMCETELRDLINQADFWRDNKKTRSEKFPEHLWDRVINLCSNSPEDAIILRKLKLNKSQLANKLKERNNDMLHLDPSQLCKIPSNTKLQDSRDNTSSKQNPAGNFSALSTIAVEFIRNDGCIMKIHTVSSQIGSLINDFFGGSNVTNNG